MTKEILGHYELLDRLGEGGMGEVWQAYDPKLQRTVAIKVLHETDDAASRILAEARAASALNHNHICTIHDVGDADGQSFIVMEHVEGKPLSELIIWIMPSAGGTARQLTTHAATDSYPAWSPDGALIAFSSNRSGNVDIWTMPVEGGEPRQISDDPAGNYEAAFSPDGDWLSFTRGGDTWRVPTAGGETERLFDGAAALWMRDSPQIYVVRNTEGQRGVWAVSPEDGAERQVTDLSDDRPGSLMHFATDGDHVYFSWTQRRSDIWVMDVVQDEE